MLIIILGCNIDDESVSFVTELLIYLTIKCDDFQITTLLRKFNVDIELKNE